MIISASEKEAPRVSKVKREIPGREKSRREGLSVGCAQDVQINKGEQSVKGE